MLDTLGQDHEYRVRLWQEDATHKLLAKVCRPPPCTSLFLCPLHPPLFSLQNECIHVTLRFYLHTYCTGYKISYQSTDSEMTAAQPEQFPHGSDPEFHPLPSDLLDLSLETTRDVTGGLDDSQAGNSGLQSDKGMETSGSHQQDHPPTVSSDMYKIVGDNIDKKVMSSYTGNAYRICYYTCTYRMCTGETALHESRQAVRDAKLLPYLCCEGQGTSI